MTITVLVVDDEPALRQFVVDVLCAEEHAARVTQAGDVDEAESAASHEQPDVALVDACVPGGGPATVRAIRRVSPHTRVAAWSAREDRDDVMDMVAAGAIGFVVKTTSASDLVAAVGRLAQGLPTLTPPLASEAVRALTGQLDRERRLAAQLQDQERRVRAVVLRGHVHAVFQPIVELETRTVAGVEALSRFGAGTRSPEVWFADAAAVGLLEDLELHALRRAQTVAASLPDHMFLTMNASPATLRSGRFVAALTLPPARIVCEVTEHAVIDDYDAIVDALAEFRAAGGRVAIDDAGAGYASMRHILRLDPDLIKLDIGLTRGIHAHPSGRALVSALVAFGRAIGADLIAEGIETPDDMEAVRDLGVRYGQGYLLARPVPIAQLFQTA